MDSLSHLFATTARRVLWQRSANTLGFFLPLGIAVFFLGYGLVLACSLPIWVSFLPPVIVFGVLLNSLRQEKKSCQDGRIAGLLDEKTDGQERFLTLVTLPSSSDFLAQIRREAARKAAFFVPERDLPFQLDRRVPLACVGAVLSGLLFLFLPTGGAALAPSDPSPSAPTPEALIQDIGEIARELIRPQSPSEEQQTEQQAGAQLLVLSQNLKNPALTPQEKIRLIDEAQKRMNLPVPIPQILPIDLKLFGSDSKQDDSPGNQGDRPQPEDTPLAKTNERLEQLKQSLSAQGREPQQGAQNQNQQNQTNQSGNQQSQKQKNTPQESGGGIQFDQPQSQDNTGKKQAQQPTAGQQQKPPQPGQKPDAQQPPSGVDPAGHDEQRRHATPQSSQEKPPQQATQPNQSDQQPGKSGGQGKGERFYKPGEQPGGFRTQDAGYVKVRIPTGIKAEQDSQELTENTNPAVPTTPYSNVPLADRPQEKNAPQQRIPLEYRSILQ